MPLPIANRRNFPNFEALPAAESAPLRHNLAQLQQEITGFAHKPSTAGLPTCSIGLQRQGRRMLSRRASSASNVATQP